MITKYKIFVFCLLFFVFLFCSKNSTNPSTVTFSGTVTLEDRNDYSGVKVSLYKLVELDTALVRINQQYPNIGVQISQETEFDHREHTPLYSTTTDASGHWQIEGVTPGTYNVVAEKDSFGWYYLYEVNEQNLIDIILYREQYLSGYITNNLTLFEKHHYVIKNDLILPQNLNLTIEKGVWLKFNGYYSFEVFGKFEISGNTNEFIHFTSNSINPQAGDWKFVRFNQISNTEIKNIILSFSTSGFRVEGAENFNVSNVIVWKNLNNGIIYNQVLNSTINNCNCRDSDIGILIQFCQTVEVTSSIYHASDRGVMLDNSVILVKSNYFLDNNIGLYSLAKPGSNIENNNFEDNKWGVFCAGTNPTFNLNHFYNNEDCIHIATERTYSNSDPIINYNNFINCNYGIRMLGSPTSPNIYDIEAQNNWWGTTSNLNIVQLIWDKNDEGSDSLFTGKIKFIPFEIQEIDSAGIIIK